MAHTGQPITSSPWTVETVTLSGADVIEKPFEIRREPIEGVTITIVQASDRW